MSVTNIHGRNSDVPPHDLDAEEALLGALLVRPDGIADVIDVVAPGDFYKPSHRVIFEALSELEAAGAEINTTTIANSLQRKDGAMVAMGGTGVLTTLMANCPSTSQHRSYANIVRQAAAMRELALSGQQIMRLAHSWPSEGAAEAAEALLEPSIKRLRVVGDGRKNERAFERHPLDLTTKPEPPEMLIPWLYAGRGVTLQSEPGVGKTWLAAWLAIQVMATGKAVIYMDEEGGPELIHERLFALGGNPKAVEDLFWYLPFESRRWDEQDLAALDELIAEMQSDGLFVGLAVLDSLPDFLAAAGLSEDSSTDVTRFVNSVLARFRAAGIAQLLLDHLRKPPAESKNKERGRYSRGSGAKLSKSDATFLLESVKEFDVRTNGTLRLWKTKDRRGYIDLPRLDQPALLLDVKVGDNAISIAAGVAADTTDWHGPTECMAKIRTILARADGSQMNQNQLAQAVGFRKQTVKQALQSMFDAGEIEVQPGARGSLVYRLTQSEQHEQQELEGEF